MNKKDKNKKDLSVWGTIAVVFALLSSFSDIMDETAFVMLAVVAVFVIVAVVFVKAIKKANASAERGGTGYANKPTGSVPQSTAPKNSVVVAPGRHVPKISFTHEKNAYTPDNGDKYIAQLNGFLKNGIIERSEYNYLLKKYRNNYTK